jgi:hypothetical protein
MIMNVLKEYGIFGSILYSFLWVFNPIVKQDGKKWKDV